jgi:hypothetical protein
MSYRDAAESLRTYRARVARDLVEARRAAQEATERAKQVAALEKELAETDALLAGMGESRVLPLLDQVQIAAPCHADWDEMVGDDRVRFCGQCEKNVYNLSSMPREEAEAFLVEREGKVCVRLYKRHDGTVLTADCPVGVRRRRRRRAAVAAVGGSLMAAAAGMGLKGFAMMGECPRPTMGAVMGEVPVATDPTTATATPTSTPTSTAVPSDTVAPPATGHWMMGARPPIDPPHPPRPLMGRIKVR